MLVCLVVFSSTSGIFHHVKMEAVPGFISFGAFPTFFLEGKLYVEFVLKLQEVICIEHDIFVSLSFLTILTFDQ